ncbi:hypothetical protein [Brachybacterium sp. AOP3-A1-3]|uniref:hypothetical protein n=1 Tax=Brachybacterium sp. AOP3-A1-3 TaxID=3457699 RepID=UPI004034DBE0
MLRLTCAARPSVPIGRTICAFGTTARPALLRGQNVYVVELLRGQNVYVVELLRGQNVYVVELLRGHTVVVNVVTASWPTW